MSNYIKSGTTTNILSTIRKNFRVGVSGAADYGPTSITEFYNGITPPPNGYTIYVTKETQGPSIHVANDDEQCIYFLKSFGSTGETISDVLAWAENQPNLWITESDLTIEDLPTPTPTPTPSPTPCICTNGVIITSTSYTILYFFQDCFGNNYSGFLNAGESINTERTPRIFVKSESVGVTGPATITYGACISQPAPTPTLTPTPTPTPGPTITIGSAVQVVAQSPFSGGGNSYQFFNANSNSYIDVDASTDWAVGTGDFTIEWFSYQTTTSVPPYQRIFTVDDFPSIDIGVSSEGGTFYYWANSSFRYSSSSAISINTWEHWAVVRRSGVTKIYKNGTLRGSQITDTNDINNTINKLTIGGENGHATNATFVGYLTNFRWVKGLAVYVGNFTVPTSNLTVTSGPNPYGGSNTQSIGSGYTKLLLIP